jgi:UDP-glucose 4-epimerase
MYSRVFITGGCGCIGSAIAEELSSRDIDVVLYDIYGRLPSFDLNKDRLTIRYGSILDLDTLELSMAGCDAIIHLAAHLGVSRTEADPLRCLSVNIDGTRNVLESGRRNGVKRFVFASSSEVYGEPIEPKVSERSVTQGRTVYAVSKLAGEELVKAYSKVDPSFVYTILRFFNTYGPNQVSQFVIPKFISQASLNNDIIVNGVGDQMRSYSYASDTARGVVLSLFSRQAYNEIFNIGNDSEPISVLNLAKTVVEVCGSSSKILLAENFEDADRDAGREIYHRLGCMDKAREVFSFSPQVSLREGIEKTLRRNSLVSDWPE